MVAGLDDLQVLVDDTVDEPVLIGDPARPCSSEAIFQRFRLPDAFVGAAAGFVDEAVDALDDGAIHTLPVLVIVPSMR